MTDTIVHRIEDGELAEIIGELQQQRESLESAATDLVNLLATNGLIREATAGGPSPVVALADAPEVVGTLGDLLQRCHETAETLVRAAQYVRDGLPAGRAMSGLQAVATRSP